MAKKPNPWFWEARNGWYVLVAGRREFLGQHPEDARPQKSKKTGRWNPPPPILNAFHRLMRGEPVGVVQVAEAADGDRLISVLDDFITWAKEHKATLTAKRCEEFCQDFVKAEVDGSKIGKLPMTQLTGKHVTAWLNARETWGPTTKRNAITALQAALNWAVLNRGLDRNPIRGMKKPEAKRRSDIITAEEFDMLLVLVAEEARR